MCKQEFLVQLRKKLSALPQEEIAERLTFYSEMIDDRMEEGLSEAEAVAAVGSAEQIASDLAPAKKKGPAKQWRVWEIVLLVLGSPVWLSLLIAAFAVVFSLYVSLWAVIVSLWAAWFAVAASAGAGILAGIVLACGKHTLSGIALIGAALVCAGLAIFLFFSCKAVTKGILLLTKKLLQWSKQLFTKKEEA